MLLGSMQWQAIRLAWSRLMHPRPVLMMMSDHWLVCCWRDGGSWAFRSAQWPEGSCRDGLPQRPEAIGELIADLLFDLNLPGAELVLSLPPASASWCVIDGLNKYAGYGDGFLRDHLRCMNLPFDLQHSYLMADRIQDSIAVAGVARSLVQAWIDVAVSADLPLRRISWSLVDAQRALVQITKDWSGDLAWLLVQGNAVRLILMRGRVPEIDHHLSSMDLGLCLAEARACVQEWNETRGLTASLAWWFTVDDDQERDWFQIVDADRGEQCLNRPFPWSPVPWSVTAELEELPSLEHLALAALHQEESW